MGVCRWVVVEAEGVVGFFEVWEGEGEGVVLGGGVGRVVVVEQLVHVCESEATTAKVGELRLC